LQRASSGPAHQRKLALAALSGDWGGRGGFPEDGPRRGYRLLRRAPRIAALLLDFPAGMRATYGIANTVC
jgi:hypothetical protein